MLVVGYDGIMLQNLAGGNPDTSSFNTEDLPKGYYLIKLFSKERTAVRKGNNKRGDRRVILSFQFEIYRAVVGVHSLLIHGGINQILFEIFCGGDVIYTPAFVIGAAVGAEAPP